MTWRRILLLWLLLALSVQLMIGEILLVQAAVSRLPDENIMLAALGVMFWLEGPHRGALGHAAVDRHGGLDRDGPVRIDTVVTKINAYTGQDPE